MIGLIVTFIKDDTYVVQKGDQVTKPIIVVKMSCKLLYPSKRILIKCFNFLALINIKVYVVYNDIQCVFA